MEKFVYLVCALSSISGLDDVLSFWIANDVLPAAVGLCSSS